MAGKSLIDLPLDDFYKVQSGDQARVVRKALAGTFSQGLTAWWRERMKGRGASGFDMFWGPSNLLRAYEEDLDESDDNTRKLMEQLNVDLCSLKAAIQEVLVNAAKFYGISTIKEMLIVHYAKILAPTLMERDLKKDVEAYEAADPEERERVIQGFVQFDATMEIGVLNEARAASAHFGIDADEFLEQIYDLAREMAEDAEDEEGGFEPNKDLEFGDEFDDVDDLFDGDEGDDEAAGPIFPSEVRRRR